MSIILTVISVLLIINSIIVIANGFCKNKGAYLPMYFGVYLLVDAFLFYLDGNVTLAYILFYLACAGVLTMLALLLPVFKYMQKSEDIRPCSHIIILGASVRGAQLSRSLQERLIAAIGYLQRNANCVAIVSGGKGRDEKYSEAYLMKAFLKDSGIDESRILLEDKSRNTFENFVFSLRLTTPESLCVCTSDTHMYRACEVAKQCDVQINAKLSSRTFSGALFNQLLYEACSILRFHLLNIYFAVFPAKKPVR